SGDDASGQSRLDAPSDGAGAVDAPASFDAAAACSGAAATKDLGQACACAAECRSGVCADGFCCDRRCEAGCMTCGLRGREGTCTPVPAGEAPTAASRCARAAASTCGLDGTCDGAGSCRK